MREREIALVADLGRLALSGVGTDELFDRAITAVGVLIGVNHVGVFELGLDQCLRLQAASAVSLDAAISPESEALEAETLRQDEPLARVATDESAEAGWSVAARLLTGPARAALTAIIRLPGRPYGVIVAYSEHASRFSEDDVVIMRNVANILGAAIARARVELELRERDLESRLAFAAGRMGVWRWEPATGTVRWSPELEALFGYGPGEFDGDFDAYLEALHPEDRDEVREEIASAAAAGIEFATEHRIVERGGRIRWIEGRGSPVRDAAGRITQWVGVAIDITARVEAVANQRDREVESRLAFTAAHMGSWRWNTERAEGVWSPELEELVGIQPGTYDGTWEGFVAPIVADDHGRLQEAVIAANRAGGEFSVRYRIAHSDGSIRWVETRGRRISPSDWIGVTLDVTELTAAEEARRDSEAILRATYDAAPVGLAFVDRELRFVWINDQLAQINGVPAERHVGRAVAEVLPTLGPQVEEKLRETLARGEPILDVALVGETPAESGVRRFFEDSFYPVRSGSGEVMGVGVVVVETTVRRESERRLNEAHERLAETVARLDTLLEHGPFGFAFFDPADRAIGVNRHFAEVTGRPVEDLLDRGIDELVPGLTAAGGAYAAGDSQSVEIGGVNSAVTGAERHWLVGRYPVRSAEGRSLGSGVVTVDITEQKRRERAAVLIGVANELLATGGWTEDWDRAAAIAVPDFADFCVLYISPRAGLSQRFAAAHVDPAKRQQLVEAEQRWPSDVIRLRAAIPGRSPFLVPEVDPRQRVSFTSTDDPRERAFAESQGARSLILVPLRRADRELGVVVFACTEESGRRYHEGDLELAQQLGQRFEQLIENSHLARDAERARSHLSVLAGVSDVLAVDLDSQARLDAIVNVVLPRVADACAIYRPSEDGLSVRLAAFASTDAIAMEEYGCSAEPTVHPVDGPAPPAVVMRTGEPLLLEHIPIDVLDSLDEHDERRRSRAAEIRSLMVTPLPGPNGLLGVIAFGLRGESRHYEKDDLLLAGEIAHRVAPAIDNALRFEQQHATATALQLALLPQKLDAVTGMAIAARYFPGAVDVQVGGDWYDAVELPGGSLLVAIGDVVGHGVAAATWMGKLRTLVQYCAFDGQSPAMLLSRLNSYCIAAADADMATVLVGVVDPFSRQIQLASAGHPPPVVVRGDGSVDIVWEGRGPPIGAATGARFEEVTVPIGPGDTLVFYTDGLVERRGEAFDQGLDRLVEWARLGHGATGTVDEFADSLIAAAFVGAPASDDVALLVLRPGSPSDDFHLELRTDAAELARLRRVAGEWLRAAGAGDDEVAELLLALNELAANAVEHAYGPLDGHFAVDGVMDGVTVAMTVTDAGRWRERPRPDGRGRGLTIARQLVDDLDIASTGSGTAVRIRRNLAGVE